MWLLKRRIAVKNYREKGIALVTALLVLMLVSSIIVSIAWLVMTDQKLGGNNSDHEVAFYGAEAGMEAITSQLAAKFDANYALSGADINTIQTTPPNDMPVQFLNPDGTNGYEITYPQDKSGNPAAANHTIVSGPYAGLVGLLTPYTLTVTARTPQGSEVKLTRLVQTAAIPVFQFGIFSDTDLSFFAGPDFKFGGRVHTNGNLWLAEDGGTLTLDDKVTAAGEVIRTNLQNDQPTTGGRYGTTVNITTNPGSGSYAALTTSQGSTAASSDSYVGHIAASYWSGFPTLASGTYKSNLGARETGVTPLNLGIATPSIGGQSIDLIRLPVPNEDTTNLPKLQERYYSQASVRILLADYGPSGTCADSDITKLPMISAGVPVDLAKLAWDTNAPAANANNTLPYSAGPVTGNATTGLVSVGPATGVYPLPVSGATNNVIYSNGYWQKQYYPVITGCLKIDYQTTAGGAFVDVTWPVLNKGYTGRNIDPDDGTNGVVFVTSPSEPGIPTKVVAASGPTINAGVTTIKCTDPSPNAIIRFARLRDNPSNAAGANNFCGTGGGIPAVQHGTDYWPNVLWDTREGNLRDSSLGNSNLTLAGAMHYVELDVANLATYLSGNASINNVTGYTLYFSDRRGDVADPTAPPSVGGGIAKTGAYGFDNIVNLGDSTNGCPDGVFDQGEDIEGDYTAGVDPAPVLRTYGNILFPTIPANLWPIYDQSAGAVIGTHLGSPVAGTTTTLINNIVKVNATCPGPGIGKQYPYAFAATVQDLRENPPLFFRRALKVVDGASLSIGTCDGVPCGLSIISENPVYIQGDYNDPTLDPNFVTGTHAASAVMADAVTLLSDNWNDVNSFAFPYSPGSRTAVTTMYRLAVVAGKGIAFKNPGAPNGLDFGTDGGIHNFLRYLESWTKQTIDYHGSIVSFYYNHQATGIYKCCNTVYNPPTRGYKFDSEFLSPSLLPPKTPMLRSINTIGFTQETLPTQ
ncbi:MAG: pilus assembly PilX family protein [Candidatus Dormibacteria bacterium]